MLEVRGLSKSFGGFRAVWIAFRDGFWAIMAPVILLGGMFSGYFTPTEAAAVATLEDDASAEWIGCPG